MHRPRLLSFTILAALSMAAYGDDPALARRAFAQSLLADAHGDKAAAVTHREAARAAHPHAIILVKRCAADKLAADDLRGASTLYRELAAARPDSLPSQLLYADFLRDSGKEDDYALNLALTTLEQARQRFPSSAEVWEKIFRLHESRGHREKAQALYDEYLQEPSADPTVAEAMARVMHDTDDANARQQVGQLYMQRFEDQPDNPELARAASDHFRKQGDKETAIDILRKHTQAAPTSLDMRVRLGILYLDAKKEPDGEKELLEVLRIDPEKHVAYQTLAKLYTRQKKLEPAREHRSRMLQIRGGDEEEFLTLANDWIAAGSHDKARILLEKACFHHQKSAELAYLAAVATHHDAAHSKDALALFRKAAKLAGDDTTTNPLYIRTAAEAFWAAGEKADAEKELRRAITLIPADQKKDAAAAMRQLAQWWQAQEKNQEAAKALLQRADALDDTER